VPVLVALIFAAVTGALAPLYIRLFRGELAREDLMRTAATGLGLSFARVDPLYPGNTALRLPFEIFSRGTEQTCENVMSGMLDGVVVQAFDFLYVLRVETRDGVSMSEPLRYSCAVATIGGDHPHLVIEPASDLALESHDVVRLEWGDFNARYRVRSSDRGFVPELLDLDLMAWLVDEAPPLALTWELQRDRLLCRAPALAPERYGDLVRAVVAFAGYVRTRASEKTLRFDPPQR